MGTLWGKSGMRKGTEGDLADGLDRKFPVGLDLRVRSGSKEQRSRDKTQDHV